MPTRALPAAFTMLGGRTTVAFGIALVYVNCRSVTNFGSFEYWFALIKVVAILAFIASWNNFLWPLIVITGSNMMTIPVGLASVQSSYGIQYAQIMASTVLAAVPMLLVFAFFQRQIVEGVSGGIK